MDEYGDEYQCHRRGKWRGHRHGARSRRYFEQVVGDEIVAHSSCKLFCFNKYVILMLNICLMLVLYIGGAHLLMVYACGWRNTVSQTSLITEASYYFKTKYSKYFPLLL